MFSKMSFLKIKILHHVKDTVRAKVQIFLTGSLLLSVRDCLTKWIWMKVVSVDRFLSLSMGAKIFS
jgi:hypothetical protein